MIPYPDLRFSCTLEQWSPEISLTMQSIPGVWVDGLARVNVPWSALPLVRGLGVAASKWEAHPSRPAEAPLDREKLCDLLEGVGVFRGLVGREPTRLFSLAPFQLETIWRLYHLGGGLLHQSMGAGKTVQAICFGALQKGPKIVVTKTSVTLPFIQAIRDHLHLEALDLPPPSHCPVKNGRKLAPEDLLEMYRLTTPEDKQWVVIGWGALATLQPLLKGFSAVIFDEIHMARSIDRWEWHSGKDGLVGELKDTRSAHAFALAEKTPIRLGLTGTPIFDRLKDLWGQLSLIEPRGWGKTAKKYLYRYCDARAGEYGGLDARGKSNEEELKARLTMVVISVPREVSHAQLPPLRILTRYVPVEEQDQTTGFKNEFRRLGKLVAKGDQEARQRLRELQGMEAAARKRTAVREEVEEVFDAKTEGKIIIFTGRHKDAGDLAEGLRKRFPAVEVLCGSVQDGGGEWVLPDKMIRERVRQKYMSSPGPCIFVGTGYAYGTGLDWHDTDLLLIVMLPWSPGDLDQWIGRVWRQGMKREVAVKIMVASGSADEGTIAALMDKVPVAVNVVGQESMAPVAEKLSGKDDRSDEDVFLAMARKLSENHAGVGEEDEQ